MALNMNSLADIGLFSGDPYCEVDTCRRGVTLSHASLLADSELAKGSDSIVEGFATTDAPPPLPQHSFFQFAPTTLIVQGLRPGQLGNSLLAFLRCEAAANSVKLRRCKFTLKADVFVQETPCTLKMRVYQISHGRLAVEMQRRAGDGVAFTVLFGMLAEHLDRDGHLVQESSSALVSIPQPRLDCKRQAFQSMVRFPCAGLAVSLA